MKSKLVKDMRLISFNTLYILLLVTGEICLMNVFSLHHNHVQYLNKVLNDETQKGVLYIKYYSITC